MFRSSTAVLTVAYLCVTAAITSAATFPPSAQQRFAVGRGAMALGNGKAIPVSGVYLFSAKPEARGGTGGPGPRPNPAASSAHGADELVNKSVFGPFPANEPAIAVDPTDPAHVIASANDYRFDDSQGGLYSTISGPSAFSDTVAQYENSGPYYYNAAGDPAVGIDRSGVDYFSVLAFDRSATGRSAILVGRSLPTEMGRFLDGPPTAVDQQSASTNIFDDKDSMSVDDVLGSPYGGSIYSAFTQFGATSSPIVGAYSRDHAATFSKLHLVSRPGSKSLCPFDGGACADDQGSAFGIGPKGVVYVAYENYDTVVATNQILIAVSHDGGASFAAPVKVADVYEIANPFETFRLDSFPNLAVNAKTGRLYVVWADQRSGSPEIEITTSANGTAGSWSAPITASRPLAGGFRFFPAVAVAPNGNVFVSYYDNIGHPSSDAYDYFYRRFSPTLQATSGPTRLSQSAILPDVDFHGQFFGDYTSAAPTRDGAEFIWTGTTTGTQDIETATAR